VPKRKVLVFVSFFFLLVAIHPAPASAQGGASGAISGIVRDSSGAPIAGASITLVNEKTSEAVRTETTDSSGLFSLTLLPVGSYRIGVTAPSFAPGSVSGVIVRVTETTRVTIALAIRSVTQQVSVTAEIATIRTTDATTGESLTETTINSLPLATRNFQQLLSLSAGASSSLNSASQLGRGDVRMNVNGGRDDNNNYQIEGINANDVTIGELSNTPLPSPDTIQEFKVSTSLYDATQGRDGGGNINAVMKTGSNDFHFDVFEYFRNTVLDANDFFLNANGQPRPVIKQNIFGGSLGGKLSPKATLGYFFINYQGTRQRSGDSPGTIISTEIPYVPAADRGTTPQAEANLANDFGLTPGTVDPVAASLLALKSNQFGGAANGFLFPLPNVAPGTAAGDVVPFAVSVPGKFTDDQFTANWDKEFRSGKDRISERFFFSNAQTFEPFGAASFPLQAGGVAHPSDLNFSLDVPLHTRFGGITETHVFSNSLVNEFRFGASVISYHFNNLTAASVSQLGIDRPTNNGTDNSYRFSFPTFDLGPNPANTTDSLSDSLSFQDTLSYTRGKHTLRVGGEYDHVSLRRNLPVADNGLVVFTSFQSFLTGTPLFGDGSSGVSNHDWHIPAVSIFGADDFRVTKSLTLNLGLRAEINGAPYDKLCHFGNTDPSLLTPIGGDPYFYSKCVNNLNVPGLTGTASHTTLNNDYSTVIEPRIGFAYDFGGHQTTSIRGGFGIYSVREDTGAVDNLSFSPPFQPTAVPGGVPNSLSTLFAGLLPPLGSLGPVTTPSFFTGFAPFGCDPNSTQCFPTYSGNAINYFGLFVPRKWISPTTQQWNFTLERALGKGWVLNLGYVGTHGLHLREVSDRAQARLATPANPVIIPGVNCDGTTGASAQCTITQSTQENILARSPFQGMAPFAFEGFIPDANSHYHGLQATLVHRLGSGLYWQSAYTFSKSIDDTSTASIAFDTRLNDQNNPRASRGLSDFDHTHRFVTSFAYEIPLFKHRDDFTGRALRDWETSGVFTLQSGSPFTVIDSAGGTAYGLSSSNLVTPVFGSGFSCANAIASRSETAFNFNPAALQPAPQVGPDSTGYGNVGRNCFRGPSQKNIDITLGRSFKFREHQALRFNAEFFNLFNHPSFATPSVLDMENPKLGSITSVVGTPRLIQFSLRYSY
jgi:hypothetical protein